LSLCLRGLSGEPDVYECTYVASTVTDLPFFSTKVKRCKFKPAETRVESEMIT
jgi:hypothetical protein